MAPKKKAKVSDTTSEQKLKKDDKKEDKNILSKKIYEAVKMFMQFNDYIIVVMNCEIFLITIWTQSKYDITAKQEKDKENALDPLEIITFVYLNFLVMKQIILTMYAEMTISMEYQKQQLTTIDLREKSNTKQTKP